MSITSLAFLLIFITGLIASALVNGAWGFYLYELVYFANPPARWWGASVPGLPYSFITVTVMMLCIGAKFGEYSRNSLIDLPLTKWFAGIVILFAATQSWAVAADLHWISLIDYCKLFITMALAYKLVDSPAKLELALWAYLAGATYIGWEAYSVGRNDFGRVEGIGTVDSPEANGVAATLVPAIPILMYFVAKGNMRNKVTAAFMGVWIVNGLVLINSRGAFLGVLAGAGFLLIYLLISSRQTHVQRMVAILIMVAGLAGMLYLTDEQFWQRMDTLREVEDESKSGSHRYRMWLSTFDLLEDYPAGVGAWGFQILSPIYVDPDLFHTNQKQKAVHSMWFQVLSELGWLGFFLFIGLVMACFRAIRKTRKAVSSYVSSSDYFLMIALEAGFVGYLVAGSFIDQFRAQILYWTILFIACAYNIHVLRADERVDTSSSSI